MGADRPGPTSFRHVGFLLNAGILETLPEATSSLADTAESLG
ncbi:MAG: hypothetical protein ACJAYU_001419 [Bradymonadia bacterium]